MWRQSRRVTLQLNICIVLSFNMGDARDRDIETLELEIRSLKLNQKQLQQNQALILSKLNLYSTSLPTPSPTPTPTPTPTTVSLPSFTVSLPVENEKQDTPPTKRQRKTVSRKYESEEQKLLLYGGNKIHLQVD